MRLNHVVISTGLRDASDCNGGCARLLNSTIDTSLTQKQLQLKWSWFNSMEVIETIVIQSTEVEGKETVLSSVDSDKTKAG